MGRGALFFGAGWPEDGGRGPVEPGAHFYHSLLIDAHGNPINKRNAWAARATVYVHLIPPGAADTVHYRLKIPADAGREDFSACKAELSEIYVVEHAVCIWRRARSERAAAGGEFGI